MEQSPKGKLNYEDVQRWLQNAKTFLAPLALIYLPFVSANLSDGLNASDFRPNELVLGAMTLYVLNTLTDLFRKWKAGT